MTRYEKELSEIREQLTSFIVRVINGETHSEEEIKILPEIIKILVTLY